MNSIKAIWTWIEAISFGRLIVAGSGVKLVGSGSASFALGIAGPGTSGTISIAELAAINSTCGVFILVGGTELRTSGSISTDPVDGVY